MTSTPDQLLSINDAVAAGITKLRKPIWAEAMDHLVITLHEGDLTPWIRLCCPMNQAMNGRDPVEMLCIMFDLDEKIYLPYEGPDRDSEEYLARRDHFNQVFKSVTP